MKLFLFSFYQYDLLSRFLFCFFFKKHKNECGLKPCHFANLELPPEEKAQNVTRLLRKQAEEVNTGWEKLNLHSADWQREKNRRGPRRRLQELQEAHGQAGPQA